MRRGAAALTAVAGLLVTACGGGASGGGTTATLGVIDVNAAVRPAGNDDYLAGEDGAALSVGDDVRTDQTGFAEIVYPDGSLTRVDRASEFRVVALSDDATRPEIEVELGVGRAWNRVKELGDGGRFEVGTSVATAAVRGTAFDVDCAFGCVFRVLEGEVDVTNDDGQSVSLTAGQAIQVQQDGTLGPLLTIAALEDPWLVRNLDLDEDAGFEAVPAPDAGPFPDASVDGTWDVRFVATDESEDPAAPPGSVSDVTFAIALSCDQGACDGVIDGGGAGTFDLFFRDGTYVIDDTEQTTTAECQPLPVFDRVVTGQLEVASVLADDNGIAATFTGTIREEFTPTPEGIEAGCAEEGVRVRVSEVRGVLQV